MADQYWELDLDSFEFALDYARRFPEAAGVTSSHYDPLELLTLDQVSALIKRSRRALTEDVANGRLRTVHLGRSVRVPRAELERYIAAASGYDGPTPIDRGGTS